MDAVSFQMLLTVRGQEALQAAMLRRPREQNFLSDFTALSKLYSRDIARPALEIAILREQAAHKFSQPDGMYFTREALEQASPQEVSLYRSQRFAPFEQAFDLGCSVGCDSLALNQFAQVIGVDIDPLRLMMAMANTRQLRPMRDNKEAIPSNLSFLVSFAQADLTQSLPFAGSKSSSQALFFDPARRSGHRRIFTVNDYSPPLSIIQSWLPAFPAIGVKISPGVNLAELEGYDCEIEFISLRGELKEASLWFGPFKTVERRATLLPGPHTLTSQVNGDARWPEQISQPLDYLYEPDPAVLRAGLVRDLAEILDAFQLDPDIAYLTSKHKTPTPFARMWAVEDWFPFQLKRLRAYLRERNVGQVIVKKRGSPLTPEALIRDLRLSGDEERTIFLTHWQGKPIVVVGAPQES